MAKWKSYKAFKPSGEVRLHTALLYKELEVNGSRGLIINTYKDGVLEQIAKTDKWQVCFENKSHYLQITEPEMVFEIVTANHTVLVLLDTKSKEKTFFAKEAQWDSYLTSNKLLVL